MDRAVAVHEDDDSTGPPIGADASVLGAAKGPGVLLEPVAVLRELENEATAARVLELVSVTHLDCLLGSVVERGSEERRTPVCLEEGLMGVAYVGSGLARVDRMQPDGADVDDSLRRMGYSVVISQYGPRPCH